MLGRILWNVLDSREESVRQVSKSRIRAPALLLASCVVVGKASSLLGPHLLIGEVGTVVLTSRGSHGEQGI